MKWELVTGCAVCLFELHFMSPLGALTGVGFPRYSLIIWNIITLIISIMVVTANIYIIGFPPSRLKPPSLIYIYSRMTSRWLSMSRRQQLQANPKSGTEQINGMCHIFTPFFKSHIFFMQTWIESIINPKSQCDTCIVKNVESNLSRRAGWWCTWRGTTESRRINMELVQKLLWNLLGQETANALVFNWRS